MLEARNAMLIFVAVFGGLHLVIIILAAIFRDKSDKAWADCLKEMTKFIK